MLLGQYTSNLGKSRRVAIPHEFRKDLGEEFVITKWYEKCLVLVSLSNWQDLLSRLSKTDLPLTSPVRDTDRFILGSAFVLKADKQGRVVLPEPLVDYAKLATEALFLGLGSRVEIWEKKEWEKRELYISSHAAGMIEEISKMNKSA